MADLSKIILPNNAEYNLKDANAIPSSDKQSYNSASSLSWNSLNATQKAMVPTIQGLAFWNGAYDGSSSNLKYSANGEICGKSGFTMTGQILTSFKSAVVPGSYQAVATTVDGLADEVRYSSGCMGSVNISTAYTKGGVTIAATWYNFLYVPHRSGGVNGSASGDNCNYGTLSMWGMTTDTPMYVMRISSAAIQSLKAISGNFGTTSTTATSKTISTGSWVTLCSVSKPTGASYGMAFGYMGFTPSGVGTVRMALGEGFDCDYYCGNTSYHPFSVSGLITGNGVTLQAQGITASGTATSGLKVAWF